jgi:hypothetical protein
MLRPAGPHAGIVEARAFYAIPLGDTMFCALVYFGFRNRFRAAAHKRLMVIATLAILEAAFARWPIFDSFAEPVMDALYVVTRLVLVMAYDWWSTGKVSKRHALDPRVRGGCAAGPVSDWPHHDLAECCRVGSDSNTFFPLKPNSPARFSNSKSGRTVQFGFSLSFDGCWIVGHSEVNPKRGPGKSASVESSPPVDVNGPTAAS